MKLEDLIKIGLGSLIAVFGFILKDYFKTRQKAYSTEVFLNSSKEHLNQKIDAVSQGLAEIRDELKTTNQSIHKMQQMFFNYLIKNGDEKATEGE